MRFSFPDRQSPNNSPSRIIPDQIEVPGFHPLMDAVNKIVANEALELGIDFSNKAKARFRRS